MAKNKTITVQGVDISLYTHNEEDYICLTDMVKNMDGEDHIRNWMRNKNTIEYLGIWESINNPNFKGVEFDTLLNQAGTNRFNLTPQKWINETNAIGIVSKSGKYGGTYAHKDIAYNFGMWLSPAFYLLVVKEYQRLKEDENKQLKSAEWIRNRFLTKENYKLHTDAIKEHIIPTLPFEATKDDESKVYAHEADILNKAVFGMTAYQWATKNRDKAKNNKNIRDYADNCQLIVLENAEILNRHLIKENVPCEKRLEILTKTAKSDLEALYRRVNPNGNIIEGNVKKEEPPKDDFDKGIGDILGYDPKED